MHFHYKPNENLELYNFTLSSNVYGLSCYVYPTKEEEIREQENTIELWHDDVDMVEDKNDVVEITKPSTRKKCKRRSKAKEIKSTPSSEDVVVPPTSGSSAPTPNPPSIHLPSPVTCFFLLKILCTPCSMLGIFLHDLFYKWDVASKETLKSSTQTLIERLQLLNLELDLGIH